MNVDSHLTEEEIISYVETSELSEDLSRHLESCEQCQGQVKAYQELMTTMESMPAAEVPAAVTIGIHAGIAREMGKQRNNHFQFWQLAAAVALLIVGFVMGKMATDDHSEENLALRSQVAVLKEVSMVNALNRSSASERLQVVNQIGRSEPDSSENLVNILFQTLNTDDSPNVRYAAAQALVKYTFQEQVRLRLAKSLERQTDPLIQISLISILTEAQEKNAIKPLRQLLDTKMTNPEVQKQAKIALEILT